MLPTERLWLWVLLSVIVLPGAVITLTLLQDWWGRRRIRREIEQIMNEVKETSAPDHTSGGSNETEAGKTQDHG